MTLPPSGLLYKLVHQKSFLISHLHEEYGRAGPKLIEDSNAFVPVSKILPNMLRDPRLNQVYLVVDALDECSVWIGATPEVHC